MAFTASTLNPIGGQTRRGTGAALWTYITSDAETDVNTEGYFNDANGMLSVNDIIMLIITSGGATKTIGLSVVLSNSSGVVDVGDVTNIVTTIPTDTD